MWNLLYLSQIYWGYDHDRVSGVSTVPRSMPGELLVSDQHDRVRRIEDDRRQRYHTSMSMQSNLSTGSNVIHVGVQLSSSNMAQLENFEEIDQIPNNEIAESWL